MPTVPSHSPSTSLKTPPHFVHTLSSSFVDNAGRTLLLRGVNLSGSSKAPVNQPSWHSDGFWENAVDGSNEKLSFVGRPLSLDDGTADVHLARLRGWGFNMLRFPVTWEALEHEGPGKYDFEYMDYTIRVLRRCKEFGFKVYLDPHQDVWSRFTGGSGAPFWTLPACGINYKNITVTQSAIVHCEYDPSFSSNPDPASFPAMIWSTNYGRLLSQTLFTFFFAGRDYAPKCILDGVNIQDYLQSHYIAAMGALADRIKEKAPELLDSCVIGWDSMNEPFEGLVGWEDLNTNPNKQGSTLAKGSHPTPAQSMRLGMGIPQEVEVWTFGSFGPSKSGMITIDPKGQKVWGTAETLGEDSEGVNAKYGWKRDSKWELGTCPWALHGVWDVSDLSPASPILKPNYFQLPPSFLPSEEVATTAHFNPAESGLVPEVEFVAHYWLQHWVAFSKRIREAHPEAILFIEPPVFAPPPPVSEDIQKEIIRGRAAYSGHYYDGLTLITRHWNWINADALGVLRGHYKYIWQSVKIGEGAIRKSLQDQLGILKGDAEILGGAGYPTIIGEIGTPFDMDGKRSYGWSNGKPGGNEKYKGDYSSQERALDASLNAADGGNCINWTVWTYCPDSSHQWGDGWNMEDLSLWCEDDVGMGRDRKALGAGDSMFTVADNSNAALLKKPLGASQSTVAFANGPTPSSLSLVTLNNKNNTFLPPSKRPETLLKWHSNPYTFLTDGARAVRAFARPWPTKVVGTPSNIEFDIAKGVFKFSVNVRAGDRGKPEDVGETSEEDEERELATEIYVPVVHYASSRLLSQLSSSSSRAASASVKSLSVRDAEHEPEESSSSSSRTMSRLGSRNPSTIHISTDVQPAPNNPPSAISQADSESPTPTLMNAVPLINVDWLAYASQMLGSSSEDTEDIVDVEVTTSAGRWEVKGQTLKWWYPVPAEGEPDVEYQVEIRRAGGVIKSRVLSSERSDGEQGEGKPWVERLCPDGTCVVM